MKKLAYFKIEENMTPREAADVLERAKKSGFEDVLVYHHEKADITSTGYKEQLLSVFRGAYRHKIGLYIADDRYDFSGTGFGQLSSVRELWQKVMVVKAKDEVREGEEILCESDGKCVAAVLPCEIDKFPYGHMPDLTNPECAALLIEGLYKPLINEYKKFVGYEFKGFLCNCPVWDCTEYENVPYSKAAAERFIAKKGNLYELAEGKASKDDYMKLFDIDKSFIKPIERFMAEEGLEFINVTEKSHLLKVSKSYDAVLCHKDKCECAVKISSGMGMLKNIGKIFEEYPDCECMKLGEMKRITKDCCIIINDKKEAVSVGLLPEGDWVVYDWERDVLCDFEKKATYTFMPESFLCLVKKEGAMYPEPLSVKVGGVLTKELEKAEEIEFTCDGNKFTFTLPEESLSGKYIAFSTEGNYMSVKMGYKRHEGIDKPCIFPLYDFLCGQRCEGEVDGKLLEICIMKETEA